MTSGLPLTTAWMGVAAVGLGRAAWMQPLEAQLPQAMIALAPSAPSCTMSRAVRPPMQQYTPSSAVGTEPSTTIRYSPRCAVSVSCRAASA